MNNKNMNSIWLILAFAQEKAKRVDDCGVLEDKIQEVMDYIAYRRTER